MVERSPYDGLPYYCALCGASFTEFNACEEVDCCVESKKAAEARMIRRRPMTTSAQQKGD